MKIKTLGAALILVTLGVSIYLPHLQAKTKPVIAPVRPALQLSQTPRVDVVFVLDTTGSMGGLIQTAKEKIWSIATTMSSAQPTPHIRIGLVAYRDRGDQYETRVVDLSDDLDSVYATLMDFTADGGGDGPESVNKALFDAVNTMSWSRQQDAYRTVFLVGDAPPHMDYNEARYPEILAEAHNLGIVVNTIQCGEMSATEMPFAQIASLGGGSYFQVEQAGSAVAFTTPFDDEIATLAAELDATRLYYGSAEEKARMDDKMAATEKLNGEASVASRARRGVFNTASAGLKNLLGEQELVAAVASGDVDLETLDADILPSALAPLSTSERKEHVAKLADERAELTRQIQSLGEEREEFLARKVEEAGVAKDSLDYKLYEAVKEQAIDAGLEYNEGPAY